MSDNGKRAIQAWFGREEVAEINQFRREQDDIPSLADAIRDLVRRGLAASARSDKRRERHAAAAE
jgi:hypothetical protein